MKQNRFLGTFLVGFIFFAVCSTSEVVAMEALEDSFKMVGEDTAVDAEGNVLKDVTQDDIEALNASIEKGELSTLDDLKTQFPDANLLSKEESQAFLQENTQAAQAVETLKSEKLSLAEPEDVGKSDIDTLKDHYRAEAAVDRVAQNAKTIFKNTSENLKDLSKDIQEVKAGKMTLQDFVDKYKTMASKIDAEAVGRLSELRSTEEAEGQTAAEFSASGAAIKQGMVDNLNSSLADFSTATVDAQEAIRNQIFNQCKDIAVTDGMKTAGDVQQSLSKETGRLGGYDEKINSVLKKQIADVDAVVDTLNPDEFEAEVSTGVKDELGNDVKQSSLEKSLKDLDKQLQASSGKSLGLLRNDLDLSVQGLEKEVGFWGRRRASLWFRDGAIGDKFNELETTLKSVTQDDIAEGFCSVGRKIKGLGGKAAELVGEGAKMLVSGVMFMIPNIFQSAFLAQKARQVELQTLASPIKYGDWVFQIPDSCFNFENPASTLPIYVRIPVADVDQAPSAQVLTAYNNSVTGPSTNNAISAAIHNVGALVASFGGALSARPQRYNLKESEYLSYNPGVILTYFAPGGYQTWGSVPVTSSQFTSGQIIDVTTGMIIDGSGEKVSATGVTGFDAYPLAKVVDFHTQQAPSLQPLSIKDFLPTIESKFNVAGDVVSYIQYSSVGSGSTGTQVSNSLKNLFDCDCLSATTCATTGACLIDRSLKQYELGLFINSDGTANLGSLLSAPATSTATSSTVTSTAAVSSSNLPSQKTLTQNISTLVASSTASVASEQAAATSNVLGSVIPLYGWGSATIFSDLVNQVTFPNFASVNLSSIISEKIGKKVSSSAVETPNFANEAQNYGAQGCWIYLCANTPFAKAVQAGSFDTSVYGPYVDYIIFLNDAGVQVPLIIPIEKTNSADAYTATTMGLNPKVKYWTSIASFDTTTFTSLPQFQDPQTGNPIKYDLQGNAYSDPALAGKNGIINAAISDLQSSFGSGDTNLAAQFNTHQKLMIDKINNGPFAYGNVSLTLSDYNLQVPGTGAGAAAQAEIVMYQGSKCFGTSVDDLLVPFDAVAGNTASLPDTNATIFYSVITDITYKVVNGSLVACLDQATCPANSYFNPPLTAVGSGANTTYNLNLTGSISDITTYNVLYGEFEYSLAQNYPLPAGVTSYITPALQKYVIAQRKAWAAQFDQSAQKQGITVGSLTFNLPADFKTNLAMANKAFIYEASPMPSAAYTDHDLFVLVSSAQPALSNLQPINAQFADSSTIAVSLLTGFLFDMNGNQLMHAVGGAPRRLDVSGAQVAASSNVQSLASVLYDQITGMFALGAIATQDFVEKYQAWMQAYETQMHRPMGPYSFGPLRVGIFAGDYAIGNYVYFDAQGMYKPDFEPEDVYMAYDGTHLGMQLDSSTPYLVSLVSGKAYQPDGTVYGQMPATQLLSQTQALQLQWGTWLQGIVNKLQQAMVQRIAAQNNEQSALDATLTQLSTLHDFDARFMTPQSVKDIIQNLQPGGTQGLAAPYSLLKHDPVRNIYVNVSPASGSDVDNLLYFFFYIGTEKSSKQHIGGIYTAAGNIVHLVKGIELQVMRDQYGVVVSPDGSKQTLGIPLTQPSFAMTESDELLTFGSDSSDQDLISSLSPYFPGGKVTMPKGLWLYYSSTMGTYYVFDVQQKRWMSVAGGHLYQKDGSPMPLAQQVAFLSSTKQASKAIASNDDMILLYPNQKGLLEGYMSNGQQYVNMQQNNNIMSWSSLTSDSSLTVTQSTNKNSYTVQDGTTTKSYNVSQGAIWYSLFAVPIDDAGALLQTRMGSSYKNAQMVVDRDKKPTHLLFHGVMYKVSSSSASSFTMVPVNPSNVGKITVDLAVDEDTTAPYVTVVDGSDTYKYLYVMNALDADGQELYQAKIKGTTTAATVAFPVGSQVSKTKTVGTTTITTTLPELTTHVIFARNIPKTTTGTLMLNPVAATSVVGVPSKGQGLTAFRKSSAAFYANLAMVLQSSDGRFFVEISPYSAASTGGVLSFSYVSNGAYVDLQTGVLYDTTYGVSLGYCLNLNDWLSVLNKVCVNVMSKSQWQASAQQGAQSAQTIAWSAGELALVYRNPQAINVQTAELVADETAIRQLTTTTAQVAPVKTTVVTTPVVTARAGSVGG